MKNMVRTIAVIVIAISVSVCAVACGKTMHTTDSSENWDSTYEEENSPEVNYDFWRGENTLPLYVEWEPYEESDSMEYLLRTDEEFSPSMSMVEQMEIADPDFEKYLNEGGYSVAERINERLNSADITIIPAEGIEEGDTEEKDYASLLNTALSAVYDEEGYYSYEEVVLAVSQAQYVVAAYCRTFKLSDEQIAELNEIAVLNINGEFVLEKDGLYQNVEESVSTTIAA